MKELLKKWETLEPERCRPGGSFSSTVLVGGTWRRVRYDTDFADDKPRVQWAVQEAIQARDWSFELRRVCWRVIPMVEAVVYTQKTDGWHESADPAEAVLAAYLKALEGQA